MKIQVIPDIHNRFASAEEAIAKAQADKVIFLGDYFDDFYDNPDIAQRTALWLRESLKQDNRIHLLGNHDLWYIYPVSDLLCSGNNEEKRRAVSAIAQPYWREKLKFAYIWKSIIFSHAGLHPSIFEHPVMGATREYVTTRLGKARENIFHARQDEVFSAGFARGGRSRYGGIFWMDWSDMTFLGDWNQIVGHTPDYNVRIKFSPVKEEGAQFNICVDTHSNHYLLITDETENGKWVVRSVNVVSGQTQDISEIA